MMEHMIKIPTERKWFRCPYCGKKLLICDNTDIVCWPSGKDRDQTENYVPEHRSPDN